MGKVLRFEFQFPNLEQAIQFYSDSFGWKFEKMLGPIDSGSLLQEGLENHASYGTLLAKYLIKLNGACYYTRTIGWTCRRVHNR